MIPEVPHRLVAALAGSYTVQRELARLTAG